MDNYKGLYYKESKEQKYYEGGAHFSYEELYEILLYIKEEQDKTQLLTEQKKDNSQIQNNKNSILMGGLNSNAYLYDLTKKKNNNGNKNKNRTRNIASNFYYNNPNTKIKKQLNKSNNQHLSIGLSYNEKKHVANSRNYKNDFNLFYNKTSNNINNDKNIFQETNIKGIKSKNNL